MATAGEGTAGEGTADDLLARAEEAHLTGDPVTARSMAQEAVDLVTGAGDWARVPRAAGLLGHTCALVGEIDQAERAYRAAGECQLGLAGGEVHLHGRPAARWGWYLRRTYRWADATEVLERSAVFCGNAGRPADAALAQVELAALELDKKLPGATLLRVRRVLPSLDEAGYVADAVQARLLVAEALLVRGRLDEAGQELGAVFDDCQAHGLLTTRIAALVMRSRLALQVDDDTHRAASDAQSALAQARERCLAWLQIDALWALAAADELQRTRCGEDPSPPGSMPRPGSFADQAARLNQRLDNQWFDLHPLRTVEQRTGR
jgi:hypothetical protein